LYKLFNELLVSFDDASFILKYNMIIVHESLIGII